MFRETKTNQQRGAGRVIPYNRNASRRFAVFRRFGVSLVPTFTYIARDPAGPKIEGRLAGSRPAAVLAVLQSRALAPVRITLKASKPDGTLVFEGAVRPTGSVTPAGPDGEPPQAVFEAAPGRLRVQMSIEDAAARVVDTDVRDVVVGPLSGPLVLGTAEVLRASSARAYRALEADATAAPVAARYSAYPNGCHSRAGLRRGSVLSFSEATSRASRNVDARCRSPGRYGPTCTMSICRLPASPPATSRRAHREGPAAKRPTSSRSASHLSADSRPSGRCPASDGIHESDKCVENNGRQSIM